MHSDLRHLQPTLFVVLDDVDDDDTEAEVVIILVENAAGFRDSTA